MTSASCPHGSTTSWLMFTKFDEINRITDDAWLVVTGASRDELLEKFFDQIWEEEARAAVA